MSIPVKSLVGISNRKGWRPFHKAATEVCTHLEKINRAFLVDLFTENGLSYAEVYYHYLLEWKKACRKMRHWHKNLMEIDEGWFEQQYKPIEQL